MMLDFPVYTKGDRHPDIKTCQVKLLSPVCDGVFGDELVVRVRGYQWAHELPATGDLDQVTLDLLLGDPT